MVRVPTAAAMRAGSVSAGDRTADAADAVLCLAEVLATEGPRWTPILIRLRDVAVLSNDFEETLAKAIDRDFVKTDPGWLSDRNINFLFILDGFDELLMEGRTSGGLDKFLVQVGRFQEQCARNSEKNHRVLITGRTLSLQSIERSLPNNLERVEILPMDDDLQNQWFVKWGRLIGQDPNYLKGILKDPRLPEQLQELAREPLLLYLLAAMHRDGALRLEMFEGAEGAKAKVLIYETALDWVLTQQRPAWLNRDIAELDTESLRRILMEAGLCVVQSGMEFARISAIEQRLQQDSAAKQFLETAQKKLATDETPLRNALAAFYMQSGRQGEGSIEFVHKSFGEFLCAERIVKSLIDWCQPGRNREYDIQDLEFCWGVYDLLGCYVLTPEIVEYVTALLTKHKDAHLDLLHKRLYDFYWRWSDGEFIDGPPENLPQRKMRKLHQQIETEKIQLGQRQIDIYAGFNCMILLFLLNYESRENDTLLPFHPCLKAKRFDEYNLHKMIGYAYCRREIFGFSDVLGKFMRGCDLSNSYLRHINLFGGDLREANLNGVDLSYSNLGDVDFRNASLKKADLYYSAFFGSNFSNADLRGANLSGSYMGSSSVDKDGVVIRQLKGANFEGADLSNADLSSCDFRDANLSGANLSGCNLEGANFEGAILSQCEKTIVWDEMTVWKGIKGLDKAIGLPEQLKIQLSFESS